MSSCVSVTQAAKEDLLDGVYKALPGFVSRTRAVNSLLPYLYELFLNATTVMVHLL